MDPDPVIGGRVFIRRENREKHREEGHVTETRQDPVGPSHAKTSLHGPHFLFGEKKKKRL